VGKGWTPIGKLATSANASVAGIRCLGRYERRTTRFLDAPTPRRTPGLPPPRGIEWWPQGASWGNYRRAFEVVPSALYARTSLQVTALAVPPTIVSASWAGLPMAQPHGRLRRGLLLLALLLHLVPLTALWLTCFFLFARLGLVDTIWPLIAPALPGSSPSYRNPPHSPPACKREVNAAALSSRVSRYTL